MFSGPHHIVGPEERRLKSTAVCLGTNLPPLHPPSSHPSVPRGLIGKRAGGVGGSRVCEGEFIPAWLSIKVRCIFLSWLFAFFFSSQDVVEITVKEINDLSKFTEVISTKCYSKGYYYLMMIIIIDA